MPRGGSTVNTVAVQTGRMGGLIRAATAPTPQAITEAALQGKEAKRRKRVLDACPGLTDEAEIRRRMDLLLRAEMQRLSLLAAKARRLKAQAAAIDRELDASGLDDAGSDGPETNA